MFCPDPLAVCVLDLVGVFLFLDLLDLGALVQLPLASWVMIPPPSAPADKTCPAACPAGAGAAFAEDVADNSEGATLARLRPAPDELGAEEAADGSGTSS